MSSSARRASAKDILKAKSIKDKYNDYYTTYVPNQLGFVMLLDKDNISDVSSDQHDILPSKDDAGKYVDREEMTKKLNAGKVPKVTMQQFTSVMERLGSKTSGLYLEQNKGDTADSSDKFFVRISISEIALMEAAEDMPLKKRLKPMIVPTLDKKPVVEGGYLNYSLCRADAYKMKEMNVCNTLLEILPAADREKAVHFKSDTDTSDDALPCVYSTLCDGKRMPYVAGSHERSVHDNYPGIFEKPDMRDSTPDSLFTDEERLEIILWKMEKMGMSIAIDDKTGKGRIEYWTQAQEKAKDDENIGVEKEEVHEDFFTRCFKGKPLPNKDAIGTAGWNKVPVGLVFFDMFTPAHDPVRRKALINDWALAPFKICNPWYNFLCCPFICCCFKSPYTELKQPIDQIKDYFGVKIAMYFLFIGHLLEWIIWPALLGVGVLGYSFYQAHFNKNGLFTYDSPVSAPYSIFLVLWATFFLEFWKRKQFQVTLSWGTHDYENMAVFRKEWLEQYERIEGTDDPQEVDLLRAKAIESQLCNQQLNGKVSLGMRGKVIWSTLAALTSILCVLIVVCSILLWTAIDIVHGASTIPPSMVSALAITVLGMLYKNLAARLTTWENHRTVIDHEDALIAKTFLFEFCNQYSALFYIAFGKPVVGPWLLAKLGNPPAPSCLVDEKYLASHNVTIALNTPMEELCTITKFCYSDKTTSRYGTCAACVNDDCMGELATQLLSILLVKSIMFKAIGILMPMFSRWWARRSYVKKTGRLRRPWYEEECAMDFYSDVSEEYKEIAIMYGYIVLFASAFPLAPLLAFITTQIELRTDAYKILHSRRPMPQKVSDIGTWMDVFENIASVSVITNIALVAFTSNKGAIASLSIEARWATIVVLEHVVLGLMWSLRQGIDDKSPVSIVLEYQIKSKFEYLHRLIRYIRYFPQPGEAVDMNLDPLIADEKFGIEDGKSCLSKPEMTELGLDMLLRKDEAIDDARHEKAKRDAGIVSIDDIEFLGEATYVPKDSYKTAEGLIFNAIGEGKDDTMDDRVVFFQNIRNKHEAAVKAAGADETKMDKV